MKIKALAVAAIIALGAAGAANAGTFWVGPMGGVSVPTGDFGDVAKLGFNGGVTGTYMIDPMWGVGADLGYHMWNAKDEFNDALNQEVIDQVFDETGIVIPSPNAEVKFSALQYTAHVLWMAPGESKTKPWAKLGVGSYNIKTKVTSDIVDFDDSANKVGFNVGGGVSFATSSAMGVGVGVAYHMINTKDDATGATNTNIITANVGLMWGFGGAAK